ncbi:ATP synthase F0 subunit A [Flavobacterium branchiophilum]|uniref:ATP synthase subunit a n=1 Tax=Flavobacterium branchiophilum TaxID=55197 RepID=A0A543G3G2_9FLAO|nr:F0F1 ATP synthase subunit A [Flavobacterium branchiophilum]OXA78327.1 ATP synthase F0 subunit A [Flavobacterium branchiophilum] [Flavobacterium branchiophilum NBRC 15030 = ATCC 35035]TQM40632.1 ATP synthase F0 subcomplex A subunit [Flavobacterium branchiophilum]GEM56390.1 ATP synthase subunit a [Flavobacterium branchiophilum NBRC 15030 = ATCC 35035]
MVISNKPLRFLFTALVVCLPFVSNANETPEAPQAHNTTVATTENAHGEGKEQDLKSEIKEFIDHHLLDAHDFTFSANKETGEHYGFSLPIILVDGGIQIFSSSKFHHGEKVAEHNGNYYVLHHEKIYKTDASGKLNEDEKTHHPTNIKPLDLSITKSVLGIILVSLLMFFLFKGLAKSYTKNAGIASGAGRFMEPLVLYVRDEIAIPNIGEKHYKKYMSYLLTIFFFIFFLNLLGLTPLGFNITGNIAITASLALLTYIITTFSANKNYWGHIFWMPGVPTPMKFILAPIELLGTIIKPFSLMIRLYANILAGHVVLMSIIGLMFVFKSWIGSPLTFGLAFALSILEILVAFLQAYIFTMLSALYFGAGNEEHHHEDAHH